eukprot:359649-Chlamydomonas_euryale.AAC.3
MCNVRETASECLHASSSLPPTSLHVHVCAYMLPDLRDALVPHTAGMRWPHPTARPARTQTQAWAARRCHGRGAAARPPAATAAAGATAVGMVAEACARCAAGGSGGAPGGALVV